MERPVLVLGWGVVGDAGGDGCVRRGCGECPLSRWCPAAFCEHEFERLAEPTPALYLLYAAATRRPVPDVGRILRSRLVRCRRCGAFYFEEGDSSDGLSLIHI